MTERGQKAKRTRRILDEHGPELVRRYEAGESLTTLGMEFDLHVGTLSNEIKRRGGRVRSHQGVKEGRAAVRDHGDEMARRYADGELLREIAADYGCGLAAVSGAVRARGVPIRSVGGGSRPVYGPENPSWRGGTHIKDGYRMILLDPADPLYGVGQSRPGGRSSYVLEHRLVMSRAIGRPLESHETVHHINGDKLDNRLENLQLRSGRHGNGVHLRCHDCGSQNVGPAPL